MAHALFAVVGVLLIGGVVFTIMRNRKINADGIEADAEISRVESHVNTDDDGNHSTTETYYVRYQNAEGAIVEAKLGNPPPFCVVGSRLRIKYLPEKPKYVIRVRN